MSPADAKRTVVVSTFSAAGIAVLAKWSGTDDGDSRGGIGRALVGAWGAGVLLGLLADPMPDLAASLAALLFVSAALTLGTPAINAVRATVGGTPA